jgi:hypothetical protein
MARRYDVYWEQELVLQIVDEPGLLISRVAPPPPPGTALPTHPFLSATALVPEHEERLRETLNSSSSLTQYLSELASLGYRIVEVAP